MDTTAVLDKDYGADDRVEGRSGEDTNRGGRKAGQQDDDQKKKDQKKKEQQKQKKLEPSLKWKNLAVEETKEKLVFMLQLGYEELAIVCLKIVFVWEWVLKGL